MATKSAIVAKRMICPAVPDTNFGSRLAMKTPAAMIAAPSRTLPPIASTVSRISVMSEKPSTRVAAIAKNSMIATWAIVAMSAEGLRDDPEPAATSDFIHSP